MRILLTLCMLGLASHAAAASSARPLDARALRQLVAGNTIYLRAGWGIELPITYRRNGIMVGQVKAMAAALAGGNRKTDSGRWWIAGGRLCQSWRHWLDGATYCYHLSRSGKTVHWRRNDGRSGTARLGG